MDALTIEEKCRRARRRARVHQQEIADLLRISVTSLSLFENGKRPLPHELTGLDYLEAVKAIQARKAD